MFPPPPPSSRSSLLRRVSGSVSRGHIADRAALPSMVPCAVVRGLLNALPLLREIVRRATVTSASIFSSRFSVQPSAPPRLLPSQTSFKCRAQPPYSGCLPSKVCEASPRQTSDRRAGSSAGSSANVRLPCEFQHREARVCAQLRQPLMRDVARRGVGGGLGRSGAFKPCRWGLHSEEGLEVRSELVLAHLHGDRVHVQQQPREVNATSCSGWPSLAKQPSPSR